MTPGAATPDGIGCDVRAMTPADAQGLSECIVRCYGDGYPKRAMYRPDELAALVAAGDYGGVVATAGGQVVGHIGFTWPARAAIVAEAGTTVVDPRHRGSGVMGRMAPVLAEALVAEGAVGFIHFPTTAHAVMQRASLSAGGRETGVMPAYLPPATRDRAIGAAKDGRLAVTVVYQPLRDAPGQAVHVPRRYAGLVAGMAAGLRLARDMPEPFRAPHGASRLDRAFDAFRGLERLAVERIGADLEDRVAAVMRDTAAGLVHVDLPMNDPGIDHAVERLRRSSFAFAAWLPGWAVHDVLRLQHVSAATDAELSPALVSPEARALMTTIRAELLGAA